MSLKVAIVGCAHGHFGQYCRQWKTRPELGITPVACWDHQAERLAKTAADFGMEAVSSLDTLLARTDTDAFVVASETSLHAELIEKLAPLRRPIALQKPMALTMPEADRIVRAVEEHACPFTMLWQMRVDPQNLRMKALMEDGTLGRVFQFRRSHNLGMALNPANAALWHFVPELNRSIWADDAAHPVDLIHWLFGMPESVTAEISTLCNPDMAHDNGVAVFRFPNGGPLVEVLCSFSCAAAEVTTEIYGSKGYAVQRYGDAVTASMPRPDGAVGLKFFDKTSNTWTECTDLPSPNAQSVRIAGLAEPLAEFFRGVRPAIATAEDGRDSLRLILASILSAVEGRRVAVSDPAIDRLPAPRPRG